MMNNSTVDLLIEAGFVNGWALHGDVLVLWEHDQDPPAPLERPADDASEPA